MSVGSTTYDVGIRYHVDSRGGSANTNALAGDVRKLETANRSAAASFGVLGVAATAAFGFVIAKSGQALIGFNSTVEETKLQIAGMLSLTKKTDLVDQVGNADRIFANLQKRAASLPGTTQEYARMAGMLTQPITDAGLGMKDLEDLTVNAVVGAKALGIGWEAAARDMDQALRGQFHSVDQFTGKILGSMGYKGEEGRAKFNALSGDKRASELNRAMTQPQLTQLAAAQGQTFGGVMSTLQDSFQQVMGKVGLPLFQSITKEIVTWNKWLDSNSLKVDQIAKSVGEGIATGFRVMKDAIGFLVEHKDTIMAMGKIWLATKVAGTLTNMGAGGLSSLAARGSAFLGRGAMSGPLQEGESRDMGSGLRQTMTMKSVAANAGLLAQSLALGYTFGTMIRGNSQFTIGMDASTRRLKELELQSKAFGDALDASAKKMNGPRALSNMEGSQRDLRQQANLVGDALSAKKGMGTIEGSMKFFRAQSAMENAGIGQEDIRKAGGMQQFVDKMNAKADELAGRQLELGVKGNIAFELGIRQLTDYQRQTLNTDQALSDVMADINRKGLTIDMPSIMALLKAATEDPQGKHKTTADKPKVNVHIARIEVQSDDPDRMAFGLIESFRDAAKNPSSAFATIREG